MKLTYDHAESFIVLNKHLTKEVFLEKVGVSSGYSFDMFSRMYDCIFSELVDIDAEYNTYYAFEYNSLETFLWKKYNVEWKEIKELMKVKNAHPSLLLYRKDELSYGDYGLFNFAFSDTMYERMKDILLLTPAA